MDLKQQTVATYNESAHALAEKFDSQEARIADIETVFSIQQKENPFVLEIGCGSGRDAAEICKHTSNYLGIDISEKLLEIAQAKIPQASFQVADVETYSFPKEIDTVFAFASLIHVPKESLEKILKTTYESLAEDGVIFLSLKHSDSYIQITKNDEFGTRTYWHYSEKDIRDIAPQFSVEMVNIHDLRGQSWMEMLLRKKAHS